MSESTKTVSLLQFLQLLNVTVPERGIPELHMTYERLSQSSISLPTLEVHGIPVAINEILAHYDIRIPEGGLSISSRDAISIRETQSTTTTSVLQYTTKFVPIPTLLESLNVPLPTEGISEYNITRDDLLKSFIDLPTLNIKGLSIDVDTLLAHYNRTSSDISVEKMMHVDQHVPVVEIKENENALKSPVVLLLKLLRIPVSTRGIPALGLSYAQLTQSTITVPDMQATDLPIPFKTLLSHFNAFVRTLSLDLSFVNSFLQNDSAKLQQVDDFSTSPAISLKPLLSHWKVSIPSQGITKFNLSRDQLDQLAFSRPSLDVIGMSVTLSEILYYLGFHVPAGGISIENVDHEDFNFTRQDLQPLQKQTKIFPLPHFLSLLHIPFPVQKLDSMHLSLPDLENSLVSLPNLKIFGLPLSFPDLFLHLTSTFSEGNVSTSITVQDETTQYFSSERAEPIPESAKTVSLLQFLQMLNVSVSQRGISELDLTYERLLQSSVSFPSMKLVGIPLTISELLYSLNIILLEGDLSIANLDKQFSVCLNSKQMKCIISLYKFLNNFNISLPPLGIPDFNISRTDILLSFIDWPSCVIYGLPLNLSSVLMYMNLSFDQFKEIFSLSSHILPLSLRNELSTYSFSLLKFLEMFNISFDKNHLSSYNITLLDLMKSVVSLRNLNFNVHFTIADLLHYFNSSSENLIQTVLSSVDTNIAEDIAPIQRSNLETTLNQLLQFFHLFQSKAYSFHLHVSFPDMYFLVSNSSGFPMYYFHIPLLDILKLFKTSVYFPVLHNFNVSFPDLVMSNLSFPEFGVFVFVVSNMDLLKKFNATFSTNDNYTFNPLLYNSLLSNYTIINDEGPSIISNISDLNRIFSSPSINLSFQDEQESRNTIPINFKVFNNVSNVRNRISFKKYYMNNIDYEDTFFELSSPLSNESFSKLLSLRSSFEKISRYLPGSELNKLDLHLSKKNLTINESRIFKLAKHNNIDDFRLKIVFFLTAFPNLFFHQNVTHFCYNQSDIFINFLLIFLHNNRALLTPSSLLQINHTGFSEVDMLSKLFIQLKMYPDVYSTLISDKTINVSSIANLTENICKQEADILVFTDSFYRTLMNFLNSFNEKNNNVHSIYGTFLYDFLSLLGNYQNLFILSEYKTTISDENMSLFYLDVLNFIANSSSFIKQTISDFPKVSLTQGDVRIFFSRLINLIDKFRFFLYHLYYSNLFHNPLNGGDHLVEKFAENFCVLMEQYRPLFLIVAFKLKNINLVVNFSAVNNPDLIRDLFWFKTTQSSLADNVYAMNINMTLFNLSPKALLSDFLMISKKYSSFISDPNKVFSSLSHESESKVFSMELSYILYRHRMKINDFTALLNNASGDQLRGLDEFYKQFLKILIKYGVMKNVVSSSIEEQFISVENDKYQLLNEIAIFVEKFKNIFTHRSTISETRNSNSSRYTEFVESLIKLLMKYHFYSFEKTKSTPNNIDGESFLKDIAHLLYNYHEFFTELSLQNKNDTIGPHKDFPLAIELMRILQNHYQLVFHEINSISKSLRDTSKYASWLLPLSNTPTYIVYNHTEHHILPETTIVTSHENGKSTSWMDKLKEVADKGKSIAISTHNTVREKMNKFFG